MKVFAYLFAALFQCWLLSPVHAQAQPPAKVFQIGLLVPGVPGSPPEKIFRDALARLGHVDGQNAVLHVRSAGGEFAKFPGFARELADLKVDVIAMVGAVTARAAKGAVTDIPLVFTIVVDPVTDRVLLNATQPEGNITGITNFDPSQARKRLELLREMVPAAKKVAVLGDSGVSEAQLRTSEAAALAMGLQVVPLRVGGGSPDLDGAFATLKQQGADALMILEEPVLAIHAKRVADMALAARLPTLFTPVSAESGGMAFYGTSLVAPIRAMAVMVDKILKGAKPGSLGVETVVQYDLIFNLKTARALGVNVPEELLRRAARVIE